MYYTIGGTICHHGILGMKWGKKNGPPYPLSASAHSASERKTGYKKSLGGGRNESLYGRDSKSDNKSNSNEKKSFIEKQMSSYTDRKTSQYEKFSLSKEEAREAAEKKAKIIKGTAIGVSVAALTLGAAYAYRQVGYRFVDQTIKSGKIMQTLSTYSDRISTGDSYYTAVCNGDKDAYKAFFGRSGLAGLAGAAKYNIKTQAKENMKIASRKSGMEALQRVIDSKKVDHMSLWRMMNRGNNANSTSYSDKVMHQIGDKLKKGKPLTKSELGKLYDTINVALVYDSNDERKVRPALYSELKKAGYSGLLDINDIKNRLIKSPTIIFDRDKVSSVADPKRLTDKEIGIAKLKSYPRAIATPSNMVYAGIGVGSYALAKYDEKTKYKGYSKLSEAEIKERLIKDYKDSVMKNPSQSKESYEKQMGKWVESQLKYIDKKYKK